MRLPEQSTSPRNPHGSCCTASVGNETRQKIGAAGGPVEVDETYVGAKPKKMHKEQRLRIASAERGEKKDYRDGHSGPRDAPGTRQCRSQRQARDSAERDPEQNVVAATVYTDEHAGYDGLAERRSSTRPSITLTNTCAVRFTLRGSRTSGQPAQAHPERHLCCRGAVPP